MRIQTTVIAALVLESSSFTPRWQVQQDYCRLREKEVSLLQVSSTSFSDSSSSGSSSGSGSLFMDDGEDIDDVLEHLPVHFQRHESLDGRKINSILDDGHGHINPELAQSIWEWDNDHRLQEEQSEDDTLANNSHNDDSHNGRKRVKEAKFPAAKLKYSTRDGLRLVDKIARELMAEGPAQSRGSATSSSSIAATADSSDLSYSDLVQEGVVALMRAMSTFDPDRIQPGQPPEQPQQTFEVYARKSIFRAMSIALASTGRPIRIPTHVHETLLHAKRARRNLRTRLHREPTLAEVADRIGVTTEKLSLYQLASRGTLSVESTVEIYDPSSNHPTSFTDLDTYEARTGKDEALLHSGEADFGLEEEEEWVEHDKVVAPLKEIIADVNSEGPDEFALGDMIRHDVDDFLTKTLDPQELSIIRMRYGLDTSNLIIGGKGLSLEMIGQKLGITHQYVSQIEQRALEKLRTSFSNSYIGAYLDDDHSEEVTV